MSKPTTRELAYVEHDPYDGSDKIRIVVYLGQHYTSFAIPKGRARLLAQRITEYLDKEEQSK